METKVIQIFQTNLFPNVNCTRFILIYRLKVFASQKMDSYTDVTQETSLDELINRMVANFKAEALDADDEIFDELFSQFKDELDEIGYDCPAIVPEHRTDKISEPLMSNQLKNNPLYVKKEELKIILNELKEAIMQESLYQCEQICEKLRKHSIKSTSSLDKLEEALNNIKENCSCDPKNYHPKEDNLNLEQSSFYEKIMGDLERSACKCETVRVRRLSMEEDSFFSACDCPENTSCHIDTAEEELGTEDQNVDYKNRISCCHLVLPELHQSSFEIKNKMIKMGNVDKIKIRLRQKDVINQEKSIDSEEEELVDDIKVRYETLQEVMVKDPTVVEDGDKIKIFIPLNVEEDNNNLIS